ncbi:MAG: ankyrin repeat domain-containing protein [Rickettsiales bacterium]|nr:ankyrin repeat domain-containing protein [Rickettsiales bacterium]
MINRISILILAFFLTNCAAHNQKLAKKLDNFSSTTDSAKIIKYLDKLDKDKINDIDGSLLRKAIDTDNPEIVNILLTQQNVSVNLKGKDALPPLGYVITKEFPNDKTQLNMATSLIEAGADVNIITTNNQTLLMLSADHNLPDITRLLIDNGADINAKASNGETAIHKSKEKVLKILVENNADIFVLDNNGNTVIHKLYYIEDIEYLTDKGLDINTTNNKGETVLFNACNSRNCNSSRIEKLIIAGADPNIKNNESITVAHLALKTLSTDSLKILLKNNADINIADNTGKTPLHYLAISLNEVNFDKTEQIKEVYESAALLFSAGADPLAKDENGNDPFTIANKIISPKIQSLKNTYQTANN